MSKNLIKLISLAALTLTITTGCAKQPDQLTIETEPASQSQTITEKNDSSSQESKRVKQFSKTELAEFNGKNGHLAYIAVDGIVYNVTNHPEWKNGEHEDIRAGKDVTEVFANSPHASDILQELEAVGVLFG